MGIVEIKAHIAEEARTQAQALVNEATIEAERILASATRDLAQHEKQLADHMGTVIAAAQRREIAAAEFEGRRMLFDSKKNVFDLVVAQARNELINLDADKRKLNLAHLWMRAQKEIAVKIVHVAHCDQNFKQKGVTVDVKDIVGGLIAETDGGRISVDLSFDSRLAELRDMMLPELSKVLFYE